MTRQTTLGCKEFLEKRQLCQCAHQSSCWSKTTISPSIFSSVSDQTKLIDIFDNIDIVHNVDIVDDAYRVEIVENIDNVGSWQRIFKDFK